LIILWLLEEVEVQNLPADLAEEEAEVLVVSLLVQDILLLQEHHIRLL